MVCRFDSGEGLILPWKGEDMTENMIGRGQVASGCPTQLGTAEVLMARKVVSSEPVSGLPLYRILARVPTSYHGISCYVVGYWQESYGQSWELGTAQYFNDRDKALAAWEAQGDAK